MIDERKLTNREAIVILKSLQNWLYFSAMNGGTKLQREAIDIAIDALKREQKCNNALRYNHSSYFICTEAQEMFITELKRQGYRFVDNDNYIEWDDIWSDKRKE